MQFYRVVFLFLFYIKILIVNVNAIKTLILYAADWIDYKELLGCMMSGCIQGLGSANHGHSGCTFQQQFIT